jgi:site-specific recombinase XerC
MVYVIGKGSGRRGPRKRAVPLGIKAAQALDRYLRERRRHPWATHEALWLGDRGRGPLSADGIKAMLARRRGAEGWHRVRPPLVELTDGEREDVWARMAALEAE